MPQYFNVTFICCSADVKTILDLITGFLFFAKKTIIISLIYLNSLISLCFLKSKKLTIKWPMFHFHARWGPASSPS